MNEKQKIEVGQWWLGTDGDKKDSPHQVVSLSPAWVQLEDAELFSFHVRRGELRDKWTLYDDGSLTEIETPADPEVMLDYEPDNTTTHAAMQAAIHAFNVVTENRLTEPDGWAILHFFDLALKSRNGLPISGMNFRTLHEESEIVE